MRNKSCCMSLWITAVFLSHATLAGAGPRVKDTISFNLTEVGYAEDHSVKLNTSTQLTPFQDRRIISARVKFHWVLPPGTMVELWVSRGDSYPWKPLGATPVDRWVMDERTGDLVQFNVRHVLLEAISQSNPLGSLYIRLSEEDRDQVPIDLKAVKDLELEVTHRSRSSP